MNEWTKVTLVIGKWYQFSSWTRAKNAVPALVYHESGKVICASRPSKNWLFIEANFKAEETRAEIKAVPFEVVRLSGEDYYADFEDACVYESNEMTGQLISTGIGMGIGPIRVTKNCIQKIHELKQDGRPR